MIVKVNILFLIPNGSFDFVSLDIEANTNFDEDLNSLLYCYQDSSKY